MPKCRECRRELVRSDSAANVCVACGIQRDAGGVIVAGSTQVGRVAQRAAIVAQRGNKGIVSASTVRLNRADLAGGEGCRSRVAGDIRVAGAINGDGIGYVVSAAAAAQVAGVDQQGVDDQRLSTVVRSDLEAHPVAGEKLVSAGDQLRSEEH